MNYLANMLQYLVQFPTVAARHRGVAKLSCLTNSFFAGRRATTGGNLQTCRFANRPQLQNDIDELDKQFGGTNCGNQQPFSLDHAIDQPQPKSTSPWAACMISPHWGLNPGPSVYRTDALPLSYRGRERRKSASALGTKHNRLRSRRGNPARPGATGTCPFSPRRRAARVRRASPRRLFSAPAICGCSQQNWSRAALWPNG